MVLQLAERLYKVDGLYEAILANRPRRISAPSP